MRVNKMADEKKTETQNFKRLEAFKTKCKQLEVALRESEENYNTKLKQTEEALWAKEFAMASAISAIALSDLEGNLTYVNDSFLKMWGYEDRKGILGKHATAFWHMTEEDEKIIEVLHDKRSWVGEIMGRRKDGTLLDVQLSANMVTDSSGMPIGMMASFIDITDCKKAKEELHESEIHYRTLFDDTPLGIGLATFNGQILSCNVAMCRMAGYSEEEFKGINLKDTYKNPEDRTRLLESLKKEGSVHNFEVELKRKDGTVYWARLTVVPYDQNVLLTVAEDITEYKRVKDALMESEERLNRFINSATECITLWDSELNLVEINESALNLLPAGTEKEDVIGRHMLDLSPDLKKAGRYDKYLDVVKTGNSFFTEDYVFDIEGREIHLDLKAFKVGDGMGMISADITERKRAEMALMESESKLLEQKSALEQKNMALRELITQIEIERKSVKDDIVTNVNTVLIPILEKLKIENPDLKYINLLQHHLEKLTSPYGNIIIRKNFNLTSREIEICNLVKGGLTNKDIGNLLNISHKTVEKHRKNIRHKLGISNKHINLSSFLREL